MDGTYVGAGVERITYNGILYELSGRICGELPDLSLTFWGECEADVKATLQGLLEEQVETLLDDHELLPKPEFEKGHALSLPEDAENLRSTTFMVVVPSSVDKDLLTTFGEYPEMHCTPTLQKLHFKAVVLRVKDSGYGGYFPDLPGAFTSGKSVEETCNRLQQLLEAYIGSLLKASEVVPRPKFHSVEDLKGEGEEDTALNLVCIPECCVEVPED